MCTPPCMELPANQIDRGPPQGPPQWRRTFPWPSLSCWAIELSFFSSLSFCLSCPREWRNWVRGQPRTGNAVVITSWEALVIRLNRFHPLLQSEGNTKISDLMEIKDNPLYRYWRLALRRTNQIKGDGLRHHQRPARRLIMRRIDPFSSFLLFFGVICDWWSILSEERDGHLFFPDLLTSF